MAFIEPKTQFQQNLDYLQGSGPLPLTGGGGGAPWGGGSGIATAPDARASISQGAPQSSAPDLSRSIEGIFNPYQGKLQDLESGVQSALGDFRQQAGPARSFQSIGGEGILGQALSDPTQGNIGQARDLANASYQGPTGLDPAAAQRLSVLSQDLGDFAQGLRGENLATLVQESNPGLTQGQARQEAQFLSVSPDFQNRLRDFSGRISSARSRLPSAQSEARNVAGQRETQERDIREASRAYLQAQEDRTKAQIDKRVAEEKAAQDALSGTYQGFQQTGDLADLAGTGFDATPYTGGTADQLAAARTLRNEIIGANPDFARIQEEYGDPLTLGVSSHGREKFRFDPDVKAALQDEGMSKKELRRLKKQSLIPTQKELEAEFAPRTARVKDEGQFSTVAPLYFGNEIQAPAARNYISFDPGVSPARENVSTEEQRKIINTVNEILDEAERLQEAGEPFRAAAITSDVERFLEDENLALEQQTEEVSGGSKAWRKAIRKARKRYRDNKHRFLNVAKGMVTGDIGEITKMPSLGMQTLQNTLPKVGSAASNPFGVMAKGL